MPGNVLHSPVYEYQDHQIMSKPIHPAAEMFPLLTGAAYDTFKADIAKNGLREPIWLCDGKILDGRNRYRACQETGIEPAFREYTGDTPVAFVWSLNGERRHLTDSQRGAIARKMLPELREEAKKRQKASRATPGHKVGIQRGTPCDDSEKGRAAKKAAERVGVSSATIERVEYVAKRDPELLKQIEAGEITATKAVEIIKSRDTNKSGKGRITKEYVRNGKVQKPRHIRAEEISELAQQGYSKDQIAKALDVGTATVKSIANEYEIELADKQIGKTQRIQSKRVIEETVTGLENHAFSIESLSPDLSKISASDAAGWAESIVMSVKTFNKLKRNLLEVANG